MNILKRLLGAGKTPREVDGAWQVPVIQEIAVAMIHQIPEEWTSAKLLLEPTEQGLGRGMRHSAITPQSGDGFALQDSHFVMPDMAVMAATRKLELGWVERKATFKRAAITATRDDSGGWGIQSEYEHP
ncbi:MAG: hypothetical protein JWQ02_4610 [Capsulimonas sp.]|nr:hypothetical protein [Capsulimonas sp.]